MFVMGGRQTGPMKDQSGWSSIIDFARPRLGVMKYDFFEGVQVIN